MGTGTSAELRSLGTRQPMGLQTGPAPLLTARLPPRSQEPALPTAHAAAASATCLASSRQTHNQHEVTAMGWRGDHTPTGATGSTHRAEAGPEGTAERDNTQSWGV